MRHNEAIKLTALRCASSGQFDGGVMGLED